MKEMEGRNQKPPSSVSRKTRLKSGCRTCRIRRVKCDETPGACLRCTSTGRTCDSYDLNRLPILRRNRPQLNQYRPRSNWAGKTSDERRCLSYFQSLTVPMMNCWFDHSLWDTVILQLVQAEPAVCHAVIAFSALHEASETTGTQGRTILLEDLTNRYHRFALEHYNRSISHLSSRICSNDPAVKNTVLLCCFLYVLFELLRGKYDRAFDHLKKGMSILKGRQSNPSYRAFVSADVRMEDPVVAAMVHLDLQGAHFGVSQLHDDLKLSQLPTFQETGDSNLKNEVDFKNLSEAWVIRDKIFHDFCVFCTLCDKLTADEVTENYAILFAQAKKHQAILGQFRQALDRLEATAYREGSITRKTRRAFDLIRLHYDCVSVVTDICLIKSSALIRERYMERFVHIINLAEQILSTLVEDNGDMNNGKPHSKHNRPRFLMETGIIAPLYLISEKSGDLTIIRRAIRVLESWPCREGLWDSELALTFFHGLIREPESIA